MSVDPPHLSPGTEVSAKYKGAFCEAKIKKCQKTVKCKVSPKDGGPQISVADDAIQGILKIGGLVKVRQPDSGQLIDGTISRIIDSSVYTVVFDDGDVATLKRTQICLKGDKHYMEGDTLDKLPLTNPEHFSTPVNFLKKERRRRSGVISNQSSAMLSDDSDEEVVSTSRRISPRGNSRQSLDEIGKVVSLCDKKKWAPALVIRPSNHEADMKNKGLIMVKSFRDSKIYTVTEKQLREFTRESVRAYSDDKLTKAALDKAYKYTMSKELPASWKREEILSPNEPTKKSASTTSSSATPTTPTAAAASTSKAADSDEDESSSSEEEEEKSDMFLAQLYKFMDDRNTPINKPAQLYNRDVNLSRLFQKIRRLGGFNKVSATGKWKSVAKKLGFTGISAGTEMKLLYRRYLCAFEDFSRKMGDTHMFEGTRSQRSGVTGGRHVLPPRDRESHADQKTAGKLGMETADKKSTAQTEKSAAAPIVEERSSPTPSGEKMTSPQAGDKKSTLASAAEKKAALPAAEKKTASASSAEKKVTSAASEPTAKSKVEAEEASRRTPLRHASKKEDKGRVTESPRRADNSAKGRGATPNKANIKVEKAAKLDLDLAKDIESKASIPSKAASPPTPPSPELPASKHKELVKPKEEPVDSKNDNDSVMSDDESMGTVNVEVDYPPGTKVKVRYGRARNVKMYDAKVTEVKLGNDKQLLYSVHYAGWNQRYDEVIPSERIVGVTGKCEKKKMDIFRAGFGPGRLKKQKSTSQAATSASSTGSRTPEPLPAGKCTTAPKNSTTGAKLTKSTSAGVAPTLPGAVSNRTTRSSAVEDLGLSRPTRSKSVDSNMSAGVVGRKPRLKRGPLAESEMKKEPNEPDAENESTDEESKGSSSCDLQPAPAPMEVSDLELNKVEAPTGSADKAPRRIARRASKHSIPAASDDSSPPKTDSVEAPPSPAPAEPDQQSKMADVTEKEPATETTAGKESEQPEESCPPSKRAKVEKEDSPGSVPCEEAFVKIEPLKHKKHEVREEKPQEDVDEHTDMVLPPLMSRSSKAPSVDSESKTSAVSSLAEESEASCSSDSESKSPSNVCEQNAPAVSQAMHTATSNLSLLSEQASLSQESITSRTKQRSLARRQQLLAAKRSPRPRHTGVDDMDTGVGVVSISPSNDEVAHITTQRISPSKALRSAPRVPRQPKHNFKIEEELAEIVDQDERIDYLVQKMALIRSLYSDVKSNLTSIERKRKRVRQRRDREHVSHGIQD